MVMLIKKRIIFFSLAVCILATWLPVSSFSAQYDDVSEKQELLIQLDILTDKLITAEEDKEINRGDFAAAIYRYAKLDLFTKGDTEQFFRDVNSKNKNYYNINACAKFGIFKGDEQGNFNSDDKMKFGYAITSLLNLLGYGEYAAHLGDYPVGIITCASEIRLTDGISRTYNENITKRDFIKMLYNALDAKIMTSYLSGTSNIVFDNNGNNTFASTFLGLRKIEGDVCGDSSIVITDCEPLTANNVLLDNKIYKTDVSVSKYIGKKAYCYVDYNDTIKGITNAGFAPETIVINAKDIVNFSNNTITYYENNLKKKLLISPEAYFSYNNVGIRNFTEDCLNIKNGEVKCVFSDSDNVCDTVIISSAKNYVIKKAYPDKKEFYDLYSDRVFSGLDTQVLSFKDVFGNDVDFNELHEYDVVSVLSDIEGEYATVLYSNYQFDGIIESIEKHDDAIVLCVDGQKFDVAENQMNYSCDFVIGKKYSFTLDVYGNIALVRDVNSLYSYAYCIDGIKDKDINNTVRLKLLCADNTIKIYTLCKRIEIDMNEYNSYESYDSYINSIAGHPIIFEELNNKISRIDTCELGSKETRNSMSKIYSGYDESGNSVKKLCWNTYQKILGAKIPVNSATKVFCISKNESNEEDAYRVMDTSYFIHDRDYCVDAYAADKNSHFADALFIYNNDSQSEQISNNIAITVIKRVTPALNNYGEKTYLVYGYYNGNEVSYFVKNPELIENLQSIVPESGKTHKLDCGDLVKLQIDSVTKVITKIELYYERESDTIKRNTPVGEEITSSFRIMKVNAYSEDSGNLLVTQNPLLSAGIILDRDSTESVQSSLYKIYKVSYKRGVELEIANQNDIIDYKTSPDNFSKMVIYSQHTNPGVIVIY